MTPRPLYRWKSFWLGVLVMAFLGWAWGLSYSHWSIVGYRRMAVSQLEGYVSVGVGASLSKIHVSQEPASRDELNFRLLPPPLFERGGMEAFDLDAREIRKIREFRERVKRTFSLLPKDYWRAYVPHWLVMLAFLGPWVSFLGWRWRRQRMLTRSEG